ncbi:hypothetical protein E2P81_ATG09300 [Venturia nashicola]|nr:hypothetical protein E2P81_ATG09300 [Venturia nashicola]
MDNVWGPNGWAKFGITEAALGLPDFGYATDEIGFLRHEFENKYIVDLVQLRVSSMQDCWWCEQLVNTLSNKDRWPFEPGHSNAVTPNAYSINLSFQRHRFFDQHGSADWTYKFGQL